MTAFPLVVSTARGGWLQPKDRGHVPVSIGSLGAWEKLRRSVEDLGSEVVRYTDFLARSDPGPAILLRDFGSFARLPAGLNRSDLPVISWSLESPAIAHRAYHRLDAIAEESVHLFAFEGARTLLGPDAPTLFHPIYYPSSHRERVAGVAWDERDHLMMINSNKRARPGLEAVDIRAPYRSLRVLAARGLGSTYKLRRQWVPADLYNDRIEAIAYFGGTGDFSLYGVGWDTPLPGQGARFAALVSRCYRGAVADKLEVLGKYKFALCIENSSFPGYISEKLFDCFFTGTIPVYLGAPDVDRYVADDAYIDLRKFATFDELDTHLRSLTNGDVDAYRTAASEYLASPRFDRFTDGYFVDEILGALRSVAEEMQSTSL